MHVVRLYIDNISEKSDLLNFVCMEKRDQIIGDVEKKIM